MSSLCDIMMERHHALLRLVLTCPRLRKRLVMLSFTDTNPSSGPGIQAHLDVWTTRDQVQHVTQRYLSS